MSSAEDLFQKVLFLEEKIGRITTYKMMEPFLVNPSDILDCQKAAKQIAEFVGLGDLVFIVARVKQDKNIGGHIELKSAGKEVFVELSENIAKCDIIPAALAHEITHKYLHRHNISIGDDLLEKHENEILTDVAGVFLGLGKLMLNGYEHTERRLETDYSGTREIKTSIKVGYLTRDEIAFVYLLVCSMRKISLLDYQKGLSVEALQSLSETRRKYYEQYFDSRLHEQAIKIELLNSLDVSIHKVQSILAEVERHNVYIEKGCIGAVTNALSTIHKRLKKLTAESRKIRETNEFDPALNYLHGILAALHTKKIISEVSDIEKKAETYRAQLTKISQLIQVNDRIFYAPSPSMFETAICHNCGALLHLPVNFGRKKIECLKCKYVFLVNTTSLSDNKVAATKKESWWHKLKRLIFGQKKNK